MSGFTIYGLSLLLASTLLLVLWRYAVRYRLVRPDAADEEVQLLTKRLTPGLGGYLVLICAGLFIPIIAVIGYLAIALYYIISFPDRIHPVPPPATTRRAISVPVTPVRRGLSRLLTDSPPRRSSPVEARIAQILS